MDYSLAPQCPYPHALNECFFVYAWALANADKLGWTGEKVCVTGDSAGGNLAVAVGLKCVQESLRRPDGIVLFYPVLSVEISVSPSRFLSLMDPLLPQVRKPSSFANLFGPVSLIVPFGDVGCFVGNCVHDSSWGVSRACGVATVLR